jgi:hypothetical protein
MHKSQVLKFNIIPPPFAIFLEVLFIVPRIAFEISLPFRYC